MMGRRSAVWLCVLLAHALVLYLLLYSTPAVEPSAEFSSELINIFLPPPEPASPLPAPAMPPAAAKLQEPRQLPTGTAAAPASSAPPARVDWPVEGRKAAARVLARKAEAERQAKLFSGPQGTWPSLTKRQPSKLAKVPWKPGIDGPEYDEQGNPVFHPVDGCALTGAGTTPTLMLTCALGKPKADGDTFKDVREHFDEQRLPETKDGNGTEPEAKRPAD